MPTKQHTTASTVPKLNINEHKTLEHSKSEITLVGVCGYRALSGFSHRLSRCPLHNLEVWFAVRAWGWSGLGFRLPHNYWVRTEEERWDVGQCEISASNSVLVHKVNGFSTVT